jgi:guanylate kinase
VEPTELADRAIEPYLSPAPVLAIITGPSGVGKDSVMHCMVAQGARFHFVVTATDRPKRPGEVHGEDYYFVTTAEFQAMIDGDELFEYAWVYNQWKGVPKQHARQALASGHDVIMRVDLAGADTIRAKVPGAVTIFLAPPSLAVLEERLRQRQTDSEEAIGARLESAAREVLRASTYDYVVINRQDDLDGAARHVMAIMEAERHRAKRVSIEF